MIGLIVFFRVLVILFVVRKFRGLKVFSFYGKRIVGGVF